MDQVPIMRDSDIKERVESLVGKNTRILDCEKKSSLVTEEVLMINGQPVQLIGEAGERIKRALKEGKPPPPELLAEILKRAGIESAPVEVETTMTMKTNTKTSELSTLKDRDGNMLDEKLKEFEEDDEFESRNVEMWEKEPEHLRDELEREKQKMWDFYKGMEPLITPKPLPRTTSPTSDKPTTNATFPSEQNSTSATKFRPESHTHEQTTTQNVAQKQKKEVSSEQKQKQEQYSKSSTSKPYSLNSQTISSIPLPPLMTQSPPKMPPLSKPSNPKIRPLVPPKPQFYTGALRREKNFHLPVRVVYETFI